MCVGVMNDDVINDGDGFVGVIDVKYVWRLVLVFERAYVENVKARAKYGNEFWKFVESEIELDCEVKWLGIFVSVFELYEELVKLNVVFSMVAVLGYENEDVVVDALEVLREFMDLDVVESDENGGKVLVIVLCESGGY